MATGRFAWGIDVGNRALKAVRVSRDGDALKIDDYEVIEHEHVLSNAGDNRDSLIQSSLANFAQRRDLRGAPVAIGVSGQSSFARFIKLPPVEPRKIPEIVKFEAIQQIPFPLEDVEWSYQLFQDPQSPDVEVGIFAMRKELVNQHIKSFTDTGLNVQVVQMNPLAVYNAMYYDQRIKGTTMIIDVGAENTDLIIADSETVWLRSIPIGGNNFTEALVKSFKLKFGKAEELKRNAATSKYGRQILQAMRPVFNDLVSEVQRSIGFYASVHRDARISRVLALGGTFRLPGLQKYMQQNLQLDVNRVDRLGNGSPADPKLATAFNDNILSSVSAYGLALQAMGDSKISSSLLPAKIRREKEWKDKTKWFGAAAALFVAGVGVGLGSYYYESWKQNDSAVVDQGRAVQRTISEAQGHSDEWTGIESGGKPDRDRIASLLSLEQYRQLVPNLLKDIHSAVPTPDPVLLSKDVKTKYPDRGKRQIMRIEQVTMEYRPDLGPTPLATMPDTEFNSMVTPAQSPTGAPGRSGSGPDYLRMGRKGRGIPMPTAAPTPTEGDSTKPKQRGFIITVVCTTPNEQGASFILNSFVKNLRSTTHDNGATPVYTIEKVTAPLTRKVSEDPDVKTRRDSFMGGGGAGSGRMPPPDRAPMDFRGAAGRKMRGVFGDPRMNMDRYRPTQPPPPRPTGTSTGPATDEAKDAYDPYKDPITGEDTLNDTQVTVQIGVLLDPTPKGKEAPKDTKEATDANS